MAKRPYTTKRMWTDSGYEGIASISTSRTNPGVMIRFELTDLGKAVLAHDNMERLRARRKNDE